MQNLTLHWGCEALWQQLSPLLPGVSVEVVASTSSTNTALLDRARVAHESQVDDGNVVVRRSVESGAFGRRAADVQPGLLVAEHQTAGRGRQGRAWESVAGASLTFSLGLPMALSDWSGLSLAVGVALSEAIGATSQAVADASAPPRSGEKRIGLKWPNDLWVMDGPHTGRKLGGVLIETVAAGALRLVVIGIGINVQPFRSEALGSGFACAQELDPHLDAPALLARVALPLVQALKLFEAQGFAAFAERFAALDVLRGQALRSVRGEAIEGIGAGVSEHGALRVQTRDGLQTISSGEISVRIDTAPGTLC